MATSRRKTTDPEPEQPTEEIPVADLPTPEPEHVAPEPDRWVRQEHISHAEGMYGQPGWLVQAVLADKPGDSFTRNEVQELLDAYNNHVPEGGQ